MLTPQEAEAHVFPKASFGGYNMTQVDTFVESLVGDYRTLYQENNSLKGKMKVLVDKVEEYRSTEDAMRRALHSAQKMAEEMIREGEAKKQAAIDSAEEAARQHSEAVRAELSQLEQEAQQRLEAVQTALANEEARLEAARASTTVYVSRLKELYTQELQYIGNLSQLTAASAEAKQEPTEQAAPAQQQTQVAQDIESSMAKILEPGQAGETHAAGDLGDTRVFDQAQFGKDHNIK